MTAKRSITLYDSEDPNIRQVCDILVEFRSTVTLKRYILFAPQESNPSEKRGIQACIIDRSVNPPTLTPIETEFEWEMIQAVFDEYIKPTKESEDVP